MRAWLFLFWGFFCASDYYEGTTLVDKGNNN